MREWRFAAVTFAALAVLFCASGLVPGRVMLPLDLPNDSLAWKHDPNRRVVVSNRLLSDAVLEFHAWDIEVRRLVSSGQFPWRNPLAGDGAHLFANPESALLFPLTWIRIAFGDFGWALASLLKLFLAGLGMWWLARVMTGCSSRAAIVAGFAYMTCGYMTAWLLSPHSSVFAMLPWLAASAITGNVAATIAAAAMATAGGHPETLFYGVIAIAVLVAWERPPKWKRAAPAAAIGFAICAVQLLPFAIAIRRSELLAERSHRPPHVRLFAIPATILPGYLGSPLGKEIDLSGISTAAENFNERSSGYAGAVALLVVVLAWRRLPRRARRGVAIGTAALVLSWLSFSIAASERLGFVFAFFICAAFGAALDAIEPRRRIAIAICAAIVTVGAVIVATPSVGTPIARFGIAMLQKRGFLRLSSAIYEARFLGYWAGFQAVALRRIAFPAACVLAAALARRKRILVAAIAAEMAVFAYGYNPSIDRSAIATTPDAIREIARLDPQGQFLIAAAPDVYPPNLATADGVRDVRSYDVLQPHSRVEMLKASGYDPASRAFAAPPKLPGVRWFITANGVIDVPGAAPQPWPPNAPPDGVAAGAAISIAALLAAAITIVRTR